MGYFARQTLIVRRPPGARLVECYGGAVQDKTGLRMTLGPKKTASWQCWRLSRGYTLQKVEEIGKSHRGRPETWDQPRPVLAVLVLAGGGRGRKLARSRVPRSTVLSRVGRGLQWRRVGVCGHYLGTAVRAQPTGQGLWQSWRSWQFLGPGSPPSSQVPHRSNCGLGTANARI